MRSKIRYLYYVSWVIMSPLMYLIALANPAIRDTPNWLKFFGYNNRVGYKEWRIMMADLVSKDKQTHDLCLYGPNCLLLIMLIALLAI